MSEKLKSFFFFFLFIFLQIENQDGIIEFILLPVLIFPIYNIFLWKKYKKLTFYHKVILYEESIRYNFTSCIGP